MKKLFATILTLTMLTGVFAGCQSVDPSASTKPSENATDNMSDSSSTNDTTSQPVVDADKQLKIAILLPGLRGDKSFFDAAAAAAPLLESEFGADVKVVEMGTEQKSWYPTFTDYCDGTYDLILTISENVNDTLVQVADENPDQKLINLSCNASFDVPANVYAAGPKQYEMCFLAGVVGAQKAREMNIDTIGFIGGMDNPGINEFLIGYIEGAKYINPDIKVTYSYVGSFTDPGKGKENALIMYKQTPIIFQAAGGSGLGVFSAAKETTAKGNQVYAIGVDTDQAMELKDSDPDAAKLIITSTIKNIPEMAVKFVKDYQDGNLKFGQQIKAGLSDEAFDIADNEFYRAIMSEDDRKEMNDIKTKIISGEIVPDDFTLMTQEEVDKIRFDARP